jgi:hypothetical protein
MYLNALLGNVEVLRTCFNILLQTSIDMYIVNTVLLCATMFSELTQKLLLSPNSMGSWLYGNHSHARFSSKARHCKQSNVGPDVKDYAFAWRSYPMLEVGERCD